MVCGTVTTYQLISSSSSSTAIIFKSNLGITKGASIPKRIMMMKMIGTGTGTGTGVAVLLLLMMIILVVINPFTGVGATFEIKAIEICWLNEKSGGINLPKRQIWKAVY